MMRDGKGGWAGKGQTITAKHKLHRDKYKDKYFVNVNRYTLEV